MGVIGEAGVVAAGVVAVLAAVTDLRSRRVPNVLTMGAAAAGVVAASVLGGWMGLGASLAGFTVGFFLFLPFFLIGGLGAGDVKLMAALGAWLGPSGALWVALLGAVAGGVLAIVVAVAHGYLGQAFRNLGAAMALWRFAGIRPVPGVTLGDARGPRLPYAIPIGVGLAVAIWMGG